MNVALNAIEAGPELLETSAALVEAARRAGADDADVWLVAGRDSSVRVREGAVDERIDRETRRLTLRVFTGSRAASGATSDLAPDALVRLAEETVALARLASPDPYAGLPDGPFGAGDGPALVDLDLVDPRLVEPGPNLLTSLAMRADQAARDHDPRLRSGEGASAGCWWGTTALVNSRGFAGSYAATTCSLSGGAVVDDAGGKKREDWWYSSGRHLSHLEAPEAIGRRAAERTLNQLGARKVPTREAPVVWAPEATREFLGILFEAAAGDARYQGFSFLIGREGQPLASPLVTIHDDATFRDRLGSRPFDGEGLASRRNAIIDQGLFRGFLHDTYSARRAELASTANAGRSGSRGSGVTVESSNLVMEPGNRTPAEIIGEIEQGLYLTGMLGFGENLTTGDFSRGASGFWIERGALAYPVGEINIAGRLQEILTGIDAVGNDATTLGASSAPTFRIDRMMISGE